MPTLLVQGRKSPIQIWTCTLLTILLLKQSVANAWELLLTKTFSWGPHVEYVRKTVSSKLDMLTRIRDYVTQSSLHTLFVSLVMPTLEYCCTVWGGRYISHNNIFNKCLKRAARMILKCTSLTPSADTFARLNWVPFSVRRGPSPACLRSARIVPSRFVQCRPCRGL